MLRCLGFFFTATKRLQKQGLKTIGTKPCNASIHTYIRPAHMDLILLAQTCYVLGSNIFTARKRLQKQGPKAMYIGRKTCCACAQLIYGQPTCISFCLHRRVSACRVLRTHIRYFVRQHTWISFCLHRHVSALKLPGARICPCARQSRFTHRHQVLGRHICAARKRLQSNG